MRLDDRLELMACKDCSGYPINEHQAALQAILTDLLEIIGEDEEQPRPNDDESRARFYRVGGKNFVRNQLRDKVRKYCE